MAALDTSILTFSVTSEFRKFLPETLLLFFISVSLNKSHLVIAQQIWNEIELSGA